jgi:uncharacterized membrane protein YqhA
MRRFLEQSRFLVLGGVVVALGAVVLAFAAGVLKVVKVAGELIHGDAGITLGLLQTIDVILIGAALLITAVGLYELFVGDLTLPHGLGGHGFDALKQKLASVVLIVMAVHFVERLESQHDPRDILASGAAIALVSGVLVVFARGKSG